MRFLAAVFMVLLGPAGIRAEVFHSRESALRLAFAGADSVVKHEMFLSAEQAQRAGELARAPLASRLITVYTGMKDGTVTGCAFIETHRVRTLPETLLIVIGPGGRVAGVHVLAFHEPPEYGSPAAWLHQFDGRALDDALSLRGDVAGITGATLTANSVTAAIRRTLAVYAVGVAPALPRPDSVSATTGAHR
ncbi:MAG: FMN-binding protein [Candidatus Krumholzibacteria bacterium]|nr:FMN-binding protein [Candidatus Krumholzibacteria bacterium]MDH4336142.1 FMN-binding protein [Candidatus Krumholzibacteria bacterium]MDH5268783.1 FMN-binding protein [Candidatus Krumholzibacteria bacterium]